MRFTGGITPRRVRPSSYSPSSYTRARESVARPLLVDIVDHTQRIADIGYSSWPASKFRFDEQAKWKRERGRDEQFSESVGLVIRSPAANEESVAAVPQSVSVLARLN